MKEKRSGKFKSILIIIFSVLVLLLFSGCTENSITNIDNQYKNITEDNFNASDVTKSIKHINSVGTTNNSNDTIPQRFDSQEKLPNNKNISFSWNFGCVRYCGNEGRPGESDGRFDITNTGNIDIPKMKLIIEFYTSSGKYYNGRTSMVDGFFVDYNKFTETIPIGSDGVMYIKVPSQYSNEETWDYAELFLLKNNTRYHVTTWKSIYSKVSDGEQYVMPPIDGNMQISMEE